MKHVILSVVAGLTLALPGRAQELSPDAKKANLELIERLEKDVRDPAKEASVLQGLERAQKVTGAMDQELHARLTKALSDFLVGRTRREVAAAKAKETAGERAAALAGYDRVIGRLAADFQKFKLMTEGDDELVTLFKEAIAESDRLLAQLPSESEAKAPERDLVSADMFSSKQQSPWGASEGVAFRPEGGLTLEGAPLEGKNVVGVVSALPPRAAPWHDVVIDVEFTVVTGELEMYLRYWPDRKSYKIRFSKAEGYEPGKPYRMTLRVKESTISLKAPDRPEERDKLDLSTSRDGGIGFGLTPGSKAVISKLTMKVLR